MNTPQFDSLSDILAGLTPAELAQRLQVSAEELEQMQDWADFTQWSQAKDPESVAWQWNRRTGRYSPCLSLG